MHFSSLGPSNVDKHAHKSIEFLTLCNFFDNFYLVLEGEGAYDSHCMSFSAVTTFKARIIQISEGSTNRNLQDIVEPFC